MMRMITGSTLRSLMVGTALLGAPLASACGHYTPGAGGDRAVLFVDNRGYFDVDVYAVRPAGDRGARLGFVNGGTMSVLRVRRSDLQEGTRLQVLVHAIGSTRDWRSETVSVGSGTAGRLTVLATTSGDLSQSSLTTESAETGAN